MDVIKSFLLTILIILLNLSNISAEVHGLYIKDIDNWLGDPVYETELLEYIQGNNYNYIVFYDLASLNFNSSTTKNSLASFINRSRTQYGVLEVGAAGEVYTFFSSNIIPYNNSRNDINDKFDILNFEFEFWVNSSIAVYCNRYLVPNGYACNIAGAFEFAKTQLQSIKTLAAANGLLTEIYLGWPDRVQMQQIVPLVDRILLHAYRPNDNDVYSYSRNRLMDIASVNVNTNVIPLFSSEPDFMGPWLTSHLITEPYDTYLFDYNADITTWGQYIKLSGYQWFTYTTMPKTFINPATGIRNLDNINARNPYPNPTTGIINMEFMLPATVILYDIIGSEICKYKCKNESIQIDITNMHPGTYFLYTYSNDEYKVETIIKIDL